MKKKLILFITMLCVIISMSAFKSNAVSLQKTTFTLLNTEFSENGVTYKYRVNNPRHSQSYLWYIQLWGDSNGTMWAGTYCIGVSWKPTYNLALSLYNGSQGNVNTLAKRSQLNRLPGLITPWKTSVITSNTKYWKASLYGYLDGDEIDIETPEACYNKKAVIYPKYTDPITGRFMTSPDIDWERKQVAHELTREEKGDYRVWVEKCYNNNESIDWSLYQIHHIRPRAYAGTNNYNNLMPLPIDFHQKKVNSWWANYR